MQSRRNHLSQSPVSVPPGSREGRSSPAALVDFYTVVACVDKDCSRHKPCT